MVGVMGGKLPGGINSVSALAARNRASYRTTTDYFEID